MVPVVVDFHGPGVDVRLERVGRIGERRQPRMGRSALPARRWSPEANTMRGVDAAAARPAAALKK